MNLHIFFLFLKTFFLTCFGISIILVILLLIGLPDYGSEKTVVLGIPSTVSLDMFLLGVISLILYFVSFSVVKFVIQKSIKKDSANIFIRRKIYIFAVFTSLVIAVIIAFMVEPY